MCGCDRNDRLIWIVLFIRLSLLFGYAYGFQLIPGGAKTCPTSRLVRFQQTFALRLNVEDTNSFDEAVVYVRGGSGGHGSNAAKFGKARQHMAPYGGSGGNGGSVYLVADSSLNTLRGFSKFRSFRAENGLNGDKEYKNGVFGKDTEVQVPMGAIVYDNSTNAKLAEITADSPRALIAKGGRGGKGNAAINKKGEKPGCTPPEPGEKKWLRLELKLLADIGLIGFPNAGKSTLLKAMTNANPKIADYAFTTLVPNLGVCEIDEDPSKTLVVADIPGLIEGAHMGIGLGKEFLKHIEKCKILIHVINGCSENPVEDYLTVNKELIFASSLLAKKPQIVVLNKIDLVEVQEKEQQLSESLQKVLPHQRFLVISAKERRRIDDLKVKTWNFYQKVLADL
jgi:GTP-binding protein